MNDIVVFIDEGQITEHEVLQQCDNALINLHETGKFDDIFGILRNLENIKTVSEKASVKLTYGLSVWYRDNEIGDDFYTWFSEKTGRTQSTVRKHELIGEFLTESSAPEEVKHLGVGELIHIARADKSGYDLSERWEDLQMAASEGEVRGIINEIKGKEPRAGSLTIYIYNDGSIVGWLNGEYQNLGWLNVADKSNESLTQGQRKIIEQGTQRIMKNSGMKEK